MMRLALVWLVVIAACKEAPRSAPPAPAPRAPAGKQTTDPGIAVGNLDANITGAEQALARTGTAGAKLTLASLLATRAQFSGRIADLERAAVLTDEAAAAEPRSAKGILARAGMRAALHRFGDARADLEAAAGLAVPADDLSWSIDGLRATLDEAEGKLDEALPRRQAAADRWPSFDNLSALAALRGDRGDREAAQALFTRALAAYRDVSPFAVAYLELQQGLLWERAGMYAHARKYYQAAHARLPSYLTVTLHLAGVEAATGEVAAAIGLVEPLLATSDDPEVPAQLAAFYERSHRDAAPLADAARAGYERLLARHPEAYADHAARFFLAAGHDPARAHALAEDNLGRRKTAEAYLLAIDAAVAAGDTATACRHAAASGHPRSDCATSAL